MNKSILRFAFMLLVSFLFIVGTKAQTAGAAISKANLPTPVTVFEDPFDVHSPKHNGLSLSIALHLHLLPSLFVPSFTRQRMCLNTPNELSFHQFFLVFHLAASVT